MSIQSFINEIHKHQDIRPYCNTAMVHDGHVYASDGGILIRVDAGLIETGLPDAKDVPGSRPLLNLDISGEPKEWSKIQLGEPSPCGHCDGSGIVQRTKCPECDGDGELELDHDWRDYDRSFRTSTYTVECRSCDGSGDEEEDGACGECGGSGVKMDHIPLFGNHLNKKYAHAIATHLPDAEIGLIEERGMYKFRQAGLVGIVMPIRV